MLTAASLASVQSALSEAGADGWLLYDFHGINPVARSLLQLEGLVSRRVFAWLPRVGTPIAFTHAIEQGPWVHWPAAWERRVYNSWHSLEAELAPVLKGRRVLMEYSPLDAVPVVDLVPGGVLEMVRALGATVASSADLVTRFFAVWTERELASHRRASEHVARIAAAAFRRAGAAARSGAAVAEHELTAWILGEFEKAGLSTDHGPIVATGEHSALPHYEPSAAAPRLIREGDAVLIDLWATEPAGIYADQTWMASIGAPSARLQHVWTVVRDARDAAIALLRERIASGVDVTGAEADDAARRVIEAAGFGAQFTHRTGHSIDARSLHGSGPNLDNMETREERVLLPGVGFSIEPGIYLPGAFGVRAEVNAYMGRDELLITPETPQTELIVL